MRTAAILIVGDEVLSGEVRDENGPWMLARLAALGSRVARVAVVPDRVDDIVDELRRQRGMADAVLVSGGIGPTHDDVTRPAVARALGVPLERHAEAETRIRAWYGARTTEAELSMAMLPRGARLMQGARTTTLGFAIGGVMSMPGVPSLLRDLVEGAAAELSGPGLAKTEVVTPLREGEIADDLTRIQGEAVDVAIGSYPVLHPDHTWTTRIVVRASDPLRAEEVASQVRAACARLTTRAAP